MRIADWRVAYPKTTLNDSKGSGISTGSPPVTGTCMSAERPLFIPTKNRRLPSVAQLRLPSVKVIVLASSPLVTGRISRRRGGAD
jgi:hypothetical protein